MASFITANEVLTQRQNGSISRCGGHGDPKIIGRLLDEAAGVDAGRVVAPSGTTNLECQEPTTAALVASAYGFTVFSPMQEDSDLTDGTPHYGDNSMVSIMTHGSMYVDCEGTVVAQAPVYVRFTSDGGSNTELGKVRGNSDGTVVIDTTANAVEGVYSITLFNGVVQETFPYTTDGSATTAEILAALVAAIDASANYSAAGTTEITVTLVAGSEIKVVELRAPTAATQLLWVVTDNQKAAILPGAYFTESRTGAGLVEINFDHRGSV
jgi:hypothetical protein